MKVLVVGGGGREHALVWKVAQSERVERLFVAPGNGGTGSVAKAENVAIAANDVEGLLRFARERAVDLTVVGPEQPLSLGIVDRFQAAGLAVFGPTQAAAQLESSKAFSKQFMEQQGIPTAAAAVYNNYRDAIHHVMMAQELPVIKVSGLAAGKGVYVPDCFNDAETALHEIYLQKKFGEAGQTVVIEERLEGPELSLLAFCDGEHFRLMPAAQDYKRLRDGDEGPNTGGMGAIAPAPRATPDLVAQIAEQVIRPTLAGMAERGTPYVGILYVGVMLTAQGPKVLEFNCRFGDPETQVILPLLQSDLVDLLLACIEGQLDEVEPVWSDGVAATVVLASGGYPDLYTKGFAIQGSDAAAALPNVLPFHAGTSAATGQLRSSGGRVLAVTGIGASLKEAVGRAYEGVARVTFERATYRSDIGQEWVSSESS